jgi:hypothetical protein
MRRVFERGEEIVKIQRETEQAGDTDFLNNAERGGGPGRVRTRKESDRKRGTHGLENVDGGTYQEMENPTKGGVLTLWRA